MYGKEKIKRELEKDGVFVSVSTVGRILTKLMKQGKIHNIKLFKKKSATKREREKCRRYAERIRKQKPKNPGELMQIDHMVLNLYNGLHIKEFRAVDPTTRIAIGDITVHDNFGTIKIVIKRLDFSVLITPQNNA